MYVFHKIPFPVLWKMLSFPCHSPQIPKSVLDRSLLFSPQIGAKSAAKPQNSAKYMQKNDCYMQKKCKPGGFALILHNFRFSIEYIGNVDSGQLLVRF